MLCSSIALEQWFLNFSSHDQLDFIEKKSCDMEIRAFNTILFLIQSLGTTETKFFVKGCDIDAVALVSNEFSIPVIPFFHVSKAQYSDFAVNYAFLIFITSDVKLFDIYHLPKLWFILFVFVFRRKRSTFLLQSHFITAVEIVFRKK